MSETNIIDCRFVKSDAEIINELKQQLAECQATNGKLLKALETIKQYLRSGNATAAYNYIFLALALPNDATALNELIAERTKELTAEVERLRLFDNLAKEYGLSVFADITELTTEVERLKDCWSAEGTHVDTLRKQNTELTAELQSNRLQMITDFGQYQEAHEKVKELTAEVERLRYQAAIFNSRFAKDQATIAELTTQRDAAMNRLAWIERKLFVSSWNGVVGNGNATTWSIAGDWRHTVAALKKDDFGESIDAAIANCK